MPSLYGGFYVAGEGQLGGYHPWHWLLYRTLPLGAAFDIELLASYPLLFAGTFLLLSRLIGRRDAALVGAMAFTFGGFGLLHFVHPNAIAVVAHLPWLLWADATSARAAAPGSLRGTARWLVAILGRRACSRRRNSCWAIRNTSGFRCWRSGLRAVLWRLLAVMPHHAAGDCGIGRGGGHV